MQSSRGDVEFSSAPSRPVFDRGRGDALRWFGCLVGLVLPTVVTWIYFIEAADYSAGAQQAIGLFTKSFQFAFPLLWVGLILRERLAWPRPTTRGVPAGLVFGALVVGAGWLLFDRWLSGSPIFAAADDEILAKVTGLGLDSFGEFVALALFYSLVHSLMEEYYWRWFVFGQLRRLLPLAPAIAISALGFMSHHVLVLAMYFGWWTWPTMLLSLAVAVGGAFWAWLYDRSGSIYGPWLSHLLVDAGIFWIGYELLEEVLK